MILFFVLNTYLAFCLISFSRFYSSSILLSSKTAPVFMIALQKEISVSDYDSPVEKLCHICLSNMITQYLDMFRLLYIFSPCQQHGFYHPLLLEIVTFWHVYTSKETLISTKSQMLFEELRSFMS